MAQSSTPGCTAWRTANLDPAGRCHASDTQAAYACAVMAQVMDGAEARPHLLRAIERHGWHLNTGFWGTYCLLPALSRCGLDDVAWRVLLQEGNPGWLYTVKNGATTMWERWNSYSPETGPVNIGNMNSYTHDAFGAVGEWMYAVIAGIDRAGASVVRGTDALTHLHDTPTHAVFTAGAGTYRFISAI